MGLFLIYVFSVFTAGAGWRGILAKTERPVSNKSTYLGEVLLCGSILLIGFMFLLSFFRLYNAWCLWGAVAVPFLFLGVPGVRKDIRSFLKEGSGWSVPNLIFCVLIGIFIFRNIFFLVDVDSNSTYLYAQRVWLDHGTSLIGSPGHDIRFFIPQFDAVPYALGLSIFGYETLFPQLVNVLWRVIALLLVFGYTAHRFTGWAGLAAAMLVMFDSHFFYSGVNQWVIINGAMVALIFAAAYNFWEARRQNSGFHFLLALIFMSQLMANKYQVVYIFVLFLAAGLLIQPERGKKIKALWSNPAWRWSLLTAGIFCLLWYVKNWIVTGDPFFPVFAGKFQVFGWTLQQERISFKYIGGRDFLTIMKYLSFLFIWPGIEAAKLVFMALIFWPVVIVCGLLRRRFDEARVVEGSFWLGFSVLGLIGLCLACHQEPRYYRYLIAIFSFTAVFIFHQMADCCLHYRRLSVVGIILCLFALTQYRIITSQRGFFMRPSVQENMAVLTDKIHSGYVLKKYFPKVLSIFESCVQNKNKLALSAWDGYSANLPKFFLPDRPMVSVWQTTLIKWDSYEKAEDIFRDLREANIFWIMRMGDKEWEYVPIAEYAKEAAQYDRFPKTTLYDYGFPEELTSVRY